MPETKYVVDALPRLSQDTTIDLANRSDVGKWSIEHYTAVVLSAPADIYAYLLAIPPLPNPKAAAILDN